MTLDDTHDPFPVSEDSNVFHEIENLPTIGKHDLSSAPSSPCKPLAKRFKVYTSSSDFGSPLGVNLHSNLMMAAGAQGSEDTVSSRRESSVPLAGSDDIVLSEDSTSARHISYDISLDSFAFWRGQSQQLERSCMGILNVPTIIYSSLKSGVIFQSAVDVMLYTYERLIPPYDSARNLWRATDLYITNFAERCARKLNLDKRFPILRRHGKHLVITSDPLTTGNDLTMPVDIIAYFDKEWDRLVSRYGELNELQKEQHSLINKAFYILCHYQMAVVTRNIPKAMKLNDLLIPLRDALDELAVNEYVIREMFETEKTPRFLLAVQE